jgi:ABC-type lipoprotein export system ATPase subunit
LPDGVVIECRGVHKRYGEARALDGLDATFSPGQVNAVRGPSGRGKSTLLRLLAGVEGMDGGSIRVGGTDLRTLRGAELRGHRRLVATLVTQRAAANLVPHARLRDQLPAPPPAELLDALGLGNRLDARAVQLSGGEQARAALAVALARRTPVLLLDEPTAELDRDTAASVTDVLRAEAARGTTIVVATHDADLCAASGSIVDLTERTHEATLDLLEARRAPGPPVLRVDGVSKRYRGTRAVDEAALELRAGETGVVLGRSGSGKSTLLMVLGGWLEPDAGAIEGPGTGWAQTGYVPQRFGLLPELSIAENVALPALVAGVQPDTVALLAQLGLTSVRDHLPDAASIGQQQRAALARALALRPTLLLADEPTSHQDARSAELVWAAIDHARAQGAACLVATHDTAAADRGDRVWQIAGGRLTDVATATR